MVPKKKTFNLTYGDIYYFCEKTFVNINIVNQSQKGELYLSEVKWNQVKHIP